MIDWSPLRQELAVWRRDALPLEVWWRDDDVISQTPALDRLTALAVDLDLPCHLAVVPKYADRTLVSACADTTMLIPMVHGWAHENHAPEGEKKAEFGHPRAQLLEDATKGLTRINALFGEDYMPCFVPPWNRITPGLLAELPRLGYAAVSTYTPRIRREAAPELVQINTHIDPIHWRGGGGLVDVETLLHHMLTLLQDRRQGRSDPREPLGLLTHHLVHDEPIWNFTSGCLSMLLDAGAMPANLLDQRDNLK